MSMMCVPRMFVHMPKCGGTSVRTAIEQSKLATIVEDYDSYFKIPMIQRRKLLNEGVADAAPRDQNSIIYGHFFPIKYLRNRHGEDYRLVTILRDPIDRLISHYRYWNTGDFSDHYLWNKMKSEKWDFYAFAFSAEMRNFYSQYFHGVDLRSFSYIGLYEDLGRATERCLDVLGVEGAHLPLDRINVTLSQESVPMDDLARRHLTEFHQKDYEIYNYAKSMN